MGRVSSVSGTSEASQSVLLPTLWGRHSYYPHFTGEETKAQRH